MKGNGVFCDCKGHEGIGAFANGVLKSPADTVAMIKRMKERMPDYVKPDMVRFVDSYEAQHGIVKYEMLDRGGEGLSPVAKRDGVEQEMKKGHWVD